MSLRAELRLVLKEKCSKQPGSIGSGVGGFSGTCLYSPGPRLLDVVDFLACL